MIRSNWISKFLLSGLLLASISSIQIATAQPVLPRYGVFVFSNLCLEKESGDTAGYRLTLMRLGDGDHVLLEWSEGPLVEAAGYMVRVDDRTSRLSFMVDLPGAPSKAPYQYSYTGEILSDAIVLKKSDTAGQGYRLLRMNDLSRKTGICSAI